MLQWDISVSPKVLYYYNQLHAANRYTYSSYAPTSHFYYTQTQTPTLQTVSTLQTRKYPTGLYIPNRELGDQQNYTIFPDVASWSEEARLNHIDSHNQSTLGAPRSWPITRQYVTRAFPDILGLPKDPREHLQRLETQGSWLIDWLLDWLIAWLIDWLIVWYWSAPSHKLISTHLSRWTSNCPHPAHRDNERDLCYTADRDKRETAVRWSPRTKTQKQKGTLNMYSNEPCWNPRPQQHLYVLLDSATVPPPARPGKDKGK